MWADDEGNSQLVWQGRGRVWVGDEGDSQTLPEKVERGYAGMNEARVLRELVGDALTRLALARAALRPLEGACREAVVLPRVEGPGDPAVVWVALTREGARGVWEVLDGGLGDCKMERGVERG